MSVFNKMFSAQLQQAASFVLTSTTTDAENTAFDRYFRIVRNLQKQNMVEPVICYQVISVVQALAITGRIEMAKCQSKLKKLFAVVYNNDEYLRRLVSQVMDMVMVADNAIHDNPANEALLDLMTEQPVPVQKFGPPPGPIC